MYCTIDDLEKKISDQKLIMLTDDENFGVVNQDRINECIQDADSEIDTYSEKLYDIPFDPVPAIIKKISSDIAAYNLFSRRPEFDMPDTIKDRHDSSIALLKRVADGTVTIGNMQQSAPADSHGEVLTTGGGVFTRDSLKGF